MKPQHLIWALAGGALLLALAVGAWHGSGSRAQVNAFAPAPAAVQGAANQFQWPAHTFGPAAADSATSAPVVVPAAPAVVPLQASPHEATEAADDNPVSSPPSASPDIDASDPMAVRERAAQHSARAR